MRLSACTLAQRSQSLLRALLSASAGLPRLLASLFSMASEGVGDHAAQSLDAFVKRTSKDIRHYRGPDVVTSTLQLVTRAVEVWYPLGEGTATES